MIFSVTYIICKWFELEAQRFQSVMSVDCQYDIIFSIYVTHLSEEYLLYDIQRGTLGYLEMIVLRFNMQGEDIMEHTNGKCHMFTFQNARGDIIEHTNANCHLQLQSTCRPMCNIGMHLMTLLNKLMPRYWKSHLNTEYRMK